MLRVFGVNSVLAPGSSETYSVFLDESVSRLHFVFLLRIYNFHLIKQVSWYKENLI